MRLPLRLFALLIVGLLGLGPAAATAWAVTTIEDLIKLKTGKVPVSDDVLIALIESDGSVFRLTVDDIPILKEKGFSDRLIVAMIQTSVRAPRGDYLKRLDEPATSPAPVSRVAYQEAVAPAPSYAQEVPAPAPAQQPPVIVNVNVTQTVEAPPQQPYYASPVYYSYPIYPVAPLVHRQIEPVYWGYGGQRRPDTWAPNRTEVIGQIPKPAFEVPIIRRQHR